MVLIFKLLFNILFKERARIDKITSFLQATMLGFDSRCSLRRKRRSGWQTEWMDAGSVGLVGFAVALVADRWAKRNKRPRPPDKLLTASSVLYG